MAKGTAKWIGSPRKLSRREALIALALAAVLFLTAWAATRLSDGQSDARQSSVVIRRVMSSNPAACYPVNGEFYDWLELANLGDAPVDLTGWKLARDADMRGAFTLPQLTLGAGESRRLYCATRPADPGDALFTGFRLSADGELVVLLDANDNWQQALSVPALGAGSVWQRGADGEYAELSVYELIDSDPALSASLRPPVSLDGLYISELMASNFAAATDADGDTSDWLELCNGGAAPVNLKGYALSDDDGNRRKWPLPELTLQPGAYLVVFCSGKDRADPAGELHANFKLNASGEAVRLYAPSGEACSWMEYDELGPNVSCSRLENGTLTTQLLPSPGFPNDEEGSYTALATAHENELGLYINEIMSSGSSYDWVELYNAGANAVDLTGMGLSDDLSHPRKWQFPEGASITPGGYVMVALTGAEGASGVRNGVYGANFGLAAGETVCLCRPDGELLDWVTIYARIYGVSYGRAAGHDRLRYFTTATPRRENSGESYARKASAVKFSEQGGLRGEGAISVSLSADRGAAIYYTTDGSKPTTASTRYTGPITVTGNMVVKAVAGGSDLLTSDVAARTYLPDVSHSVRVVCLSGERDELNGSEGALNTGVRGRGTEVYVEVYDTDGAQLVGQACRFLLAGHNSRVTIPQKSFSLRANAVYGNSTFQAALFTNRDYDWYKSIVMRASGQDARKTLMRDSLLTALAADTSLMYQETEVSVLYVNGEYWGVYNMRERVSKHSIAQFMGWDDPDSVDIIEGGGGEHVATTNGSGEGFISMLKWVRSHDLSDPANLELLRQYVDVENYLEYVMLEMYTCNEDMNNVRMYRNRNEDGKWRWVLCDLDLSYNLDKDNATTWLNDDVVGSITSQDNSLFKALMKNPEVRDWFLTRFGQLLATTLSVDSLSERIRVRYEILVDEMPRECERWDWSMASWRRAGNQLLRYAQKRPVKLIGYLVDAFKLNNADAERYFGEALRVNQQ